MPAFESRRDKYGFAGGILAIGLVAGGIGWAVTGNGWWMLSFVPALPLTLCDCKRD